ncbi:LytR family transcriptional regulator [Acidaminobacter sp. JC074]|uniref:LCP family protein n=1 Tax=Acidaminobacter sp. JC074 TaxID=2530199 RepID=UPI001F1156D0|nr:LCP family protein [Acidaminobacter sp. JC074]MCH4887146.1 LytR family transcriptional regulator [Acidaminobacter sp. JC074]
MKFYIKLFVLCLVGFTLLFAGVWKFMIKDAEIDQAVVAMPETVEQDFSLPGEDEEPTKEDEKPTETVVEEIKKSPLELLVEESDRVNFVVFAHDGSRADTIMFASFDPSDQLVDIISIPRDTYWLVEGYTERADHKKINAVYGHAGEKGGSLGLKQEISNMLGVPVHYYVKFNYNGAAAVVDTLGGIEVNVPFDMKYDDVWAEPELHIDIKAGQQVLDGKNAVDYLRWRQNNDDITSTGDLPRIDRMQDFIKKAIKKSMSLKLPAVVSTGIQYVQTDIAANLAISYADDAIGMSTENIVTHDLPGEAPPKSSYFIGDPAAIEKLLVEIYSKGQ